VPGYVVTSRVESFSQYLTNCPANTRAKLRQLRAAIRAAAPTASETISYHMPAFSHEGKVLVWFGTFKSHIGFYPGGAAIRAFRADLKEYATSKGSVRFPLAEPLPLELIRKIVRFRCEGVC
jgi:uncharacterized protein YdhG (YjbR/CyaY superfamily)